MRDLGGWVAGGAGYIQAAVLFELDLPAPVTGPGRDYLASLALGLQISLCDAGSTVRIPGVRTACCPVPEMNLTAAPTNYWAHLATGRSQAAAFGAAIRLMAAAASAPVQTAAERVEVSAVAVGHPTEPRATAWCTALVLLAAGVPEAAVLADFDRRRDQVGRDARQRSELLAAGLAAARGVAGGSIDRYFADILKVHEQDRAALHRVLLP